jgi:hypothetical protein
MHWNPPPVLQAAAPVGEYSVRVAIDLVIYGDTLGSEYPDWVFSGGFAVPQVPSGGSASGAPVA